MRRMCHQRGCTNVQLLKNFLVLMASFYGVSLNHSVLIQNFLLNPLRKANGIK